MLDDSDFYPFGWERPVASSSGNTYKFTGKERDSETGLDNFGARYFGGGNSLGRFMTPDPLYLEMHRLADPQQLNLYAYTRNNPVSLTDQTGLLININCAQVDPDQCKQVVTDLNNRQDAHFQVTRNDNGNLQVVNQGNVDVSKLSSSEAALFNAITDPDHTARLNVVPQSDTVQFGAFKGAGLNVLDASDLNLLARADPKAAGETVAHEALEAYHSLNGGIEMDFTANHDWANQFFGQVTHPFNGDIPATADSPAVNFRSWNFGRLNESFMVKTVLTPVPAASIQAPRSGYPPGNIVEVNKDR